MKTYYRSAGALLGMMAVLSFGACADDDIVNERKDVKDGLGFSVSDIQDAAEDQTRAIATHPEDYAVRQLDFAEAAGNACLQETTVPGVNPVKRDAATRSDFQNSIGAPFGAFACKNGSGKPDFFYNEKVNANGNMVSPKIWTSDESVLQFYAVYPFVESSNPNVKLTQTVAGELPCIDFTTPTDIANQIDLMTASTQNINHTNTGGGEHVVPLTFYHSLTAIRFGVGSNLSWGKTIKSVEFQGVYSKGRYDIKTKTWSNQSTAQNYKLDNIGVSTSAALNNVILKNGNTFLMVPQTLPAGAKIVVTFSDNTSVTAKIEGKKWKPGTTKTYMITEKNSNWNYIIQTTDPSAAAYDATQTGDYGITSYRQAPDGTKRPVAWRVVKYQESTDGGATWSAESDTPPAWLTALSLTQGDGGTAAQQGNATVQKAPLIDKLAPYNLALRNAPPQGSATNYYDLSMHDYRGNATLRNTANSYLISAPGYYKIPLVYGNAIKNGGDNPSSYKTNNTDNTYHTILKNFVDHAGANITSPYINVQNAAKPATQAYVVWSNVNGIVENLAITGSGNDSFVEFHVPASKICNSNTVIAIKNADGTVMWSWHLWFDHADALNTIPCTNYGGIVYKFTKRNLGFALFKWEVSVFTQPRKVRVKVEQEMKNNGTNATSYLTITQNPGSVREMFCTQYQHGRKDAIPSANDAETLKEGQFLKYDGGLGMGITIPNGIQNPEKIVEDGWGKHMFFYTNLWSMENTKLILTLSPNWEELFVDDPVVKTIYDPCPVGFHMPASNAFTGFTTTGRNSGNPAEFNVIGGWDDGWHFNNKLTSPTATLYFPFTRSFHQGAHSWDGNYWSALCYRKDWSTGYAPVFWANRFEIRVKDASFACTSCMVRPVADE